MNRIAIIGGGGAGLLSAWLLQNTHSVVLFEEEPFLGGHAHSVPIQTERGVVWVDTGFRYFFPHTYPIFTAALKALQVPICTRPAGMSFSDGRGENTLTAPPTNARSLLSLASSPQHLLWSASFYWFLRAGLPLVAAQDWRPSLREYLITSRIPTSVQQNYLLPSLASFWGAPVEAMPDFPAYDVLRVMQQGKFGTPYYSFVEGGGSTYARILRERSPRGPGRDGGAGATAQARRQGLEGPSGLWRRRPLRPGDRGHPLRCGGASLGRSPPGPGGRRLPPLPHPHRGPPGSLADAPRSLPLEQPERPL